MIIRRKNGFGPVYEAHLWPDKITGRSTLLYSCIPNLVMSGRDALKRMLAEKGKLLRTPDRKKRRGTEMSAIVPLPVGNEEGWELLIATEKERRQLEEAGYWFDR